MQSSTASAYRITDHDRIVGESNQDYVLRIRDLADADKPREKLVSIGPQALSVAELVAVLWGVGSKKEDVLAMAHRTVREYGEHAMGNVLNADRLAETAELVRQAAVRCRAHSTRRRGTHPPCPSRAGAVPARAGACPAGG